MNKTDNRKVIKSISNTVNNCDWMGPVDSKWSWLKTLLPDTMLYIKKDKNGIIIDDFGNTFAVTAAFHNLKMKKFKDFNDILDIFNIDYNTLNNDLYVKVPLKDAMVGISRMEQAIIHIQDLLKYRLADKED